MTFPDCPRCPDPEPCPFCDCETPDLEITIDNGVRQVKWKEFSEDKMERRIKAAANLMEPIEAEEARVVAESFLASPQIDTVTIVRRWVRSGSIVPSLMFVLALAGVAGAVFAPTGSTLQVGAGSVCVASVLSLGGVIVSGCVVSSKALRRPWLTRLVVVAWGIGVYFGSVALFFALPHSVASGLLKLIGM